MGRKSKAKQSKAEQSERSGRSSVSTAFTVGGKTVQAYLVHRRALNWRCMRMGMAKDDEQIAKVPQPRAEPPLS